MELSNDIRGGIAEGNRGRSCLSTHDRRMHPARRIGRNGRQVLAGADDALRLAMARQRLAEEAFGYGFAEIEFDRIAELSIAR